LVLGDPSGILRRTSEMLASAKNLAEVASEKGKGDSTGKTMDSPGSPSQE
jgi:hypothetical protein